MTLSQVFGIFSRRDTAQFNNSSTSSSSSKTASTTSGPAKDEKAGNSHTSDVASTELSIWKRIYDIFYGPVDSRPVRLKDVLSDHRSDVDDLYKFVPYPTVEQRLRWLFFKNEFGFKSWESSIVSRLILCSLVLSPLCHIELLRGLRYRRLVESFLYTFRSYRQTALRRAVYGASCMCFLPLALALLVARRGDCFYRDFFYSAPVTGALMGVTGTLHNVAVFCSMGLVISFVLCAAVYMQLAVRNNTISQWYADKQQEHWERNMRKHIDNDLADVLAQDD